MGTRSHKEREVRAGRNQAMFRAVNEKVRELNQAFGRAPETLLIACECADPNCAERLDISLDEYEALRANPLHFAVFHGHVYPDVERVVAEPTGHVVVEKAGAAAKVAEETA